MRLRSLALSRRGTLAHNPRGVDSYLYQQKVLYTDFTDHAQALTKTLCQQTEQQALEQHVPLRHLNSPDIQTLAQVAQPTTLGELLAPLGEPVYLPNGRRVRALNPLTGKDGALLRVLAQGEFLVNGFRNRDLRQALHGEASDAAERRRQSARVTRLLALLRAHGLIVAVAKTHRYHLSAAGQRVAAALLAAHHSDAARLAHGA